MARSGIGGYVGIAAETVYGTPVTPVTFLPITSSSLVLTQEDLDTFSLRGGQLGLADGQSTPTTRAGAGTLEMNVQNKGMGKLLNLLNGNANAPTTPGGATLARLFTFDVGLTTPEGKSLTYQTVDPDTGGTSRPFTGVGVKATGVTFSVDTGGVLTMSMPLDASDELTATAAATPTWISGQGEFSFQGASIELDDVVVLDCIRSISVEVTLPMAGDRYCLGNGGTKKEPIVNDQVTVTATAEAEFASMTQYTAFRNATRRKLEANFTGPQIESGQNFEFNLTLPRTRTMAPAPELSGPDILTQTLEFKGLQTAGNPLLSIGVKTTDTAL